MKIPIVLALLFSIAGSAGSQQKFSPLKFDEFEISPNNYYYYDKDIRISERIDRLIAQVKKMRGVRVYVISYRARKMDESNKHILSNWAYEARSRTAYQAKLRDEDVVSIDGGVREKDILEFWIGAKDGDPPIATPTYTRYESFDCPEIYVHSTGMNLDSKEPVSFSASIRPEGVASYKWTASTGKIIEGQGTSSIKVDLEGSKRVTVYVELDGLPSPCNRSAYTTTDIGMRPILIITDERYNHSSLSALIDNFMAQVNENPSMRGYIVVYASRSTGNFDRDVGMKSVRKDFAFRKYSFDQVTLVSGGYREYNSVDFWLLPPGVEPPKPTPTVDGKLVPIPRKGKVRK